MKQFIIILASLLVMLNTESFAQKKQKRAQIKQMHIQKVKECVSKDSLYIEINRINPMGTTPKSSSYSYFVKVCNGKASLYLPYMGKMTTAVLGGEKLSIEAREQSVKLQKESDPKNECTYYLFNFNNENRSERWECVFQLYDNGYVIMKLSCPGRDPVGFHGDLKVD